MIGNDIVDLKQAAKNSNWQRSRFLDKVFTEREQQLILYSRDQHQMVWLLWSMKEAAYKVNVQQFGKRFFNPKQLECKLVSNTKGKVTIDNETYFITSEISKDYVYTVAVLKESIEVDSLVFKIKDTLYKTQSDSLKQFFLKSISERKKIPLENLEIRKTEVGVPQLFKNSEKLLISLSLTHCGLYSGFVYY